MFLNQLRLSKSENNDLNRGTCDFLLCMVRVRTGSFVKEHYKTSTQDRNRYVKAEINS